MRWTYVVLFAAGLACGGPTPDSSAPEEKTEPVRPAAAAETPSSPPTLPEVPEAIPVGPPGDPEQESEPFTLTAGDGIKPPRRISGGYPPLFDLHERYSWTLCVISAVVSREGRLEDLKLLRPENAAPEAERIILGGLESMRFEPAERGGEPVAVKYHLTIHHCPCLERTRR